MEVDYCLTLAARYNDFLSYASKYIEVIPDHFLKAHEVLKPTVCAGMHHHADEEEPDHAKFLLDTAIDGLQSHDEDDDHCWVPPTFCNDSSDLN